MIKLQDTIIQTDTQSVLDMLKFDLSQNGIIHKNIIDWLLKR